MFPNLSHALAAASCAALLFAAPVSAHEGHDHGEEKPAAVQTPGSPTLQASSAEMEFVAIADGGHLIIYVDRYATNEPITDAAVQVAVNGGADVAADARPDGTYLLEAPWSQEPGEYQIVATVVAGDLAELLDGSLVVPQAEAAVEEHASIHFDGWLPLALAFGGGLAVAGMTFGLGRRNAVPAALVLVLVGSALTRAEAHEGHDHAEQAPVPVGTDAPQRLSDGSITVPKATQRLLAVRTVMTEEIEAPRTISLAGRVIADPNFSGRVQATQPGLVEAPKGGLPRIGQRVEAGQIVAHVTGAVDTVERGDVLERIADVEKQLEIARRRVARYSKLTGVLSEREIEEAEAELAGLQRQRAALEPTLTRREALRAPVSGIVAAVNAVPGQMIDDRAEAILFEIVDPSNLLVEAVAFENLRPDQVKGGVAVSGAAQAKLEFLGSGPMRRESAIPLMFRVQEQTAGFGVGTPVQVNIHLAAETSGIVLPRESVVRGPDGLPMVWTHAEPLRFEARQVRTRALDGAHVVVEAGLEPGTRVVAQGAALLSQIR